MKQAKAAGIKVVETTAADCNAPNVGHKALFDATDGFAPGGFYDFIRVQAQIHADWALAQLGGKQGKILVVHQTDYNGLVVMDKLFAQHVHKVCSGCDVVDVPFVYTDLLGPQLKAKVQAGLVQNPDAKVLTFPYDATLTYGGAAAVQGSGRAGKLKVMGGECSAADVALIRQGTVTACVGNPYSWLGWQTVDDINRVLNGQRPGKPSVGQQLVDKSHNLPVAGHDYDGDGRNYKAAYQKIWNDAK